VGEEQNAILANSHARKKKNEKKNRCLVGGGQQKKGQEKREKGDEMRFKRYIKKTYAKGHTKERNGGGPKVHRRGGRNLKGGMGYWGGM